MREACRSGAAGCTSSASAGRPTWRSPRLPGFTLPGDVSGSDKYYAEDIVEPPILAHRGGDRDVRRARPGRRAGRGADRGADAARRSRSRREGGQYGRPGSLEARRDGVARRDARLALASSCSSNRRAATRRRSTPWARSWRTDCVTWAARSRSSPTTQGGDHVLARFPGPGRSPAGAGPGPFRHRLAARDARTDAVPRREAAARSGPASTT